MLPPSSRARSGGHAKATFAQLIPVGAYLGAVRILVYKEIYNELVIRFKRFVEQKTLRTRDLNQKEQLPLGHYGAEDAGCPNYLLTWEGRWGDLGEKKDAHAY